MSETSNERKIKCVAVIQCDITHERCTGAQCAAAFTERKHLFAGYEPEAVYYVPFTCGGCPGRRVGRLASQLARVMKNHDIGRDEIAVHLSSCMAFESGHYPPCPHVEDIRTMLGRKGLQRLVEGSHISPAAERRRAEGLHRKRPGQTG